VHGVGRSGGVGVFRKLLDGVQDAARLAAAVEDVAKVDRSDAKQLGGIYLSPSFAAQCVSCGLHTGWSFLVCGRGH
jgi:hypothetical protein